MAWNIGADDEAGLWVGGENIITRDLLFLSILEILNVTIMEVQLRL